MIERQNNPAYPGSQEEVNEGLDILWDTAKRIVTQVLAFQPDVVLSLLHSGWVPARAAQLLWQATQAQPFPPLVKTNLGREKIRSYPGGSKKIGNVNFMGDISEPWQVGHFLAWLVQQHAWHAELKGQIQEQLPPGETPHRILIIDDWIAEGNTWILTLGLLDIIYPEAEKHFVAGILSWKRGFCRLWLELFHPHLLEQLDLSRDKYGMPTGDMRAFFIRLNRLVSSTEDIDPASFDWQPVTASSQDVQTLSEFIPPEELLELPRFVNRMIEGHIGKRIDEYQRGMLDHLPVIGVNDDGFFPRLKLEYLVLRDLWLEEYISRRQIIERYNVSSGQAYRLLKSMLRRGLLVRQGSGRSTAYCLHSNAYPSPPLS